MEGLIIEVLEQVTQVLEAVQEMLPVGFREEVFAAVWAGMLDAVNRLTKFPFQNNPMTALTCFKAYDIRGRLGNELNVSVRASGIGFESRPSAALGQRGSA